MALFIGGPADGWRIETPAGRKIVDIAINPHAPAFTPDTAVLAGATAPVFQYKQELLTCGREQYTVYIPLTWDCDQLLSALVIGYNKEAEIQNRLDYVRSAEGRLYDNDDRHPDGRPYKV